MFCFKYHKNWLYNRVEFGFGRTRIGHFLGQDPAFGPQPRISDKSIDIVCPSSPWKKESDQLQSKFNSTIGKP